MWKQKTIAVSLMLALSACASADPRFTAGLKSFQKADYESALAKWHPAADAGVRNAQHGIGWLYEKGLGVEQSYKTSANWYLKAAAQGHGGAQLNLGNYFDSGKGFTKDYKIAAGFFAQAAKNNIAEAQNNLGQMYKMGHGVEQDLEAAANLFLAAARQNYAPAQNAIGIMYFKGQGIEQDAEKAYFWISLAALNGQEGTEHNLTFVASFLEKKQIDKIDEEATEWIKART